MKAQVAVNLAINLKVAVKIKEILDARGLHEKINKENEKVSAKINKIREEYKRKASMVISDTEKQRLVSEYRSLQKGIYAKEYISTVAVEMKTSLSPFDIFDKTLSLEDAQEIYKGLGEESPDWLTGMIKEQSRNYNLWETPLQEFYEKELRRHGGNELDSETRSTILLNTNEEHYLAVEEALAKGKPVPAKILEDYPDLETNNVCQSGCSP